MEGRHFEVVIMGHGPAFDKYWLLFVMPSFSFHTIQPKTLIQQLQIENCHEVVNIDGETLR